ncbi:hypothetical protein [Photorhabdus sp. SF281]|uniref:hypothetical protein n=1 Tax=Photorhabdus sp. SF281 TaxID=3459527 RepID=UPI004044BA2B
MAIIRLKINVRYEQQEVITVDSVLMDLFRVTRQIDIFFGQKKTWYLTGYSLKEALKHVVFDEKGPTSVAIRDFEKEYRKNFPSLINGMWDGQKNELSCGIIYEKSKSGHPNWVRLELNLKIGSSQLNVFRLIDLVKHLATSRHFPYIQVETNGYTLKGRQVFPDRLSIGWMLYQPRIIDKSYLPMAEDVLPVHQNNEQIGTLIVTKKGIFDGRNQDDIDKSNDIEIQLVNLGLLPLITEV